MVFVVLSFPELPGLLVLEEGEHLFRPLLVVDLLTIK